jgi:hypothetical protein
MFDTRTQPLNYAGKRRRPLPRKVLWLVVGGCAVLVAALTLSAAKSSDPSADAAAAGRTATMVVDRETGATLVESNPTAQFRSASLVKLLIAVDALTRPKSEPQVSRMLSLSDDQIASTLWSQNGAQTIVTRTAKTMGLKHTEPPAVPGRWGDTLLSASDVVTAYEYILALPQAKRDVLLKALRAVPRVAADGTDQYFGIPRALDAWPWAIKQGWASGQGGTEVHTSGLVGEKERYIVVVLSSYSQGAELGVAMKAVTTKTEEIARLLEAPSKAKKR